jgi:DNA mismatch repair protein MutS
MKGLPGIGDRPPKNNIMGFLADKQTTEDLNLLGKYTSGSVYQLFNQVRTRGGERLLEVMFREPLTDPPAINRRANVFGYLQGKPVSFSFDRSLFELSEDYLGGKGGANRLSLMAAVIHWKWMELLLKDERYEVLAAGIRATISLIHAGREFVRQFSLEESHPLAEEVDELRSIVEDHRLAGLPDGIGLLSWSLAARYDHLFRQLLRRELGRMCELLYQFDVYIAVSGVARARGFSYAQALPKEDNVFRAANLRHPCLEEAMGNTLCLAGDSNVLFLTGANMAGKSTLMKSFGISVYLAHMGFPLAAEGMVFSVKEGLFSSINVSDNLNLGYSHFYAEVLRVKQVAGAVSRGNDLIVIFDELFKGTNVMDAYDATLAVTQAFSEYRNCFFVVSTHIVEVGAYLRERAGNLQFQFLPTVMEGTRPRYTYKLEEGISADRHGMLIIENEGVLSYFFTSDFSSSSHLRPANS